MSFFLTHSRNGLTVGFTILLFVLTSHADINCAAANPPSDPVECMACNIKYESGDEPIEGQRGVVYTVYNRALNRTPGGKSTICGQIYEKDQYSWTKPEIQKDPTLKSDEAEKFKKIAKDIMDEIDKKQFPNPPNSDGDTNCATHYHTEQKNVGGMGDYPDWSAWGKNSGGYEKAGKIGGHLFSRDGKGMPKCVSQASESELSEISKATGIGAGSSK